MPWSAGVLEQVTDWLELKFSEPRDPIYVLLSGDLTCYGRESDFATAHGYFRCKRPVDLDRPAYELGLGLGSSYKLLAIPGNHDHWNGLRLPARPYNAGIFPTEFRTTAWWKQLSSSSGQFQLQLFCLDSNSGLRGLAGQHAAILARGKVSDREFDQLEEHLVAAKQQATASRVVRVLMVHHSFDLPNDMVGAQALHPDSARRILDIADQHGIFAVLTGHIHRSRVWPYRVRARRPVIWEMRCATTLQGPAGGQTEQGFFVHQIVLEKNLLLWKLWQYIWRGDTFLRGVTPLHTFIVPE